MRSKKDNEVQVSRAEAISQLLDPKIHGDHGFPEADLVKMTNTQISKIYNAMFGGEQVFVVKGFSYAL